MGGESFGGNVEVWVRLSRPNSFFATQPWKEITRRNLVKAHPQAEPSEFERRWPKALANFLLAETVRVAKSLSALSENRNILLPGNRAPPDRREHKSNLSVIPRLRRISYS